MDPDLPAVTPADIAAAAARIAGYVRTTPVLELPRGALGGDFVPVLKLELTQHAGSFKPRGAFNNLLTRAVPASGVAAASGGNHGVAVAYAAAKLGHRARIFVPEIFSPAKVAAIRSHGAEVTVGGARYADALAACDEYVRATGALAVHAYDARETVAGQGTLAREWDAQCDALDSALVVTGGGGLVAGMGAWWQGRVRTLSVEPEGSRALHAALEGGGPVDVEVHSVAADSLGARNTGALVYGLARRYVARALLVPDDAIRAAQRALWVGFRLATEPGGATALAAVLCGAYQPAPGERVGILVCGGNVDLAKLAEVAG